MDVLPDHILAAYGLQLPAAAPVASPDPLPAFDSDLAGLHPAVAQALGLPPAALQQPPPVASPGPPPFDADLAGFQPALPVGATPAVGAPPAFATPPPPERPRITPSGLVDDHGNVVDTGRPDPRQSSASLARPLTPEQGFAHAQAREDAASSDAERAAVTAGQAQQQRDVGDLAAAQGHLAAEQETNKRSAQIEDERSKSLVKSQAIIEANRAAVDNYKIDQGKYWREAGVGDHIGWFVAMALSGIGDAIARRNGPNPVVQMLQDKIKQSAEAQVDQREQLKEKLGRSVQDQTERQQGFASRQAEVLRLQAQGDRMFANLLDVSTRQSAPTIDRARIATTIAGIRADAAGKEMQAVKNEGEYAVQKATVHVAQQNAATAAGHLGIAKLQFAADYGPEGFKQQDRELKAAEVARQMAHDAAMLAAKKAGKLDENEAKFAVSAPIVGSGGKSVVLRNEDGSAWTGHQDKEETTTTSKLIAAVDEYHQLAGKMIQSIKDHGGSSDFVKSDDWKRQQVRLAELQANLHDVFHIQRFSEGTQDLFTKVATAGVDPTSFVRDASAALKTSADDLTAKVNSHLQAANYTGKPLQFADLSTIGKSVPTEEEQRVNLIKSNPDVGYETALAQSLKHHLAANPSDPTTAVRAANAEAASYRTVTPDQRRAIEALVAKGDAQAAGELEQYAAPQVDGGAHSKAVRELAADGVQAIKIRALAARGDDAALGELRRIAGGKKASAPVRSMASQAANTLDQARATATQTATPQAQNYDPNGYDPASLIRRFSQPAGAPTLP